jgi:hypothetical protein
MTDYRTAVLQRLIERMQDGDEEARRDLIDLAYERLRHLSAIILRKDFPRLKGHRPWSTPRTWPTSRPIGCTRRWP